MAKRVRSQNDQTWDEWEAANGLDTDISLGYLVIHAEETFSWEADGAWIHGRYTRRSKRTTVYTPRVGFGLRCYSSMDGRHRFMLTDGGGLTYRICRDRPAERVNIQSFIPTDPELTKLRILERLPQRYAGPEVYSMLMLVLHQLPEALVRLVHGYCAEFTGDPIIL